jgi:hypothetical protein
MINQINTSHMPFHIIRRMFDPIRMIEKSKIINDWEFITNQEEIIVGSTKLYVNGDQR